MNNRLMFQPGASLIGDVLWQSGLFLGIGLVLSLALNRSASLAHRVLVLAMVGALVTPLFSQIVQRVGWGFLSTSVPHSPPVVATSTAAISSFDSLSGTVQPTWTEPVPTRTRRDGAEHLSTVDQPITTISTRAALMGLWCVLSGLSLARLVVSLVLGRRIIGRARPIACESTEQDVDTACTRLGLRYVRSCASSRVACPAIWCWGRRPVIVLPESSDLMAARVNWAGVFCHELAHWLRRDHWSSLLGELLVCVLPWHPLAWLAKQRLGQLSELACDDWVLASGQEPAAYAETLLELIPRRRMTTALAAVSRRNGLAGRVAHILATDGPVEPRPGGRFSGVVVLAVVALASLIALAQAREGGAQADAMKKTPGQAKAVAAPAPASPRDQATHRVIREVFETPRAGRSQAASIFAVSQKVLAQASSDGDGRFTLDLPIDPTLMQVDIVSKAPGMGLTGRNFSIRPDGQGEMRFEVLSDQLVDMTLAPRSRSRDDSFRRVVPRFRARRSP